jgi:hypothetical protein
VNDVIGKIPDRQVQTNVAKAYGEIEAAANRETEMSDAEFRQKLRSQERTAQNEADIDWISALSAASSVMFE